MAFFFWYGIRDGTRTHLNATRMSVAADGWTEANLYFRNAKMQIESYIVHQRKSHPDRDGFFAILLVNVRKISRELYIPRDYEFAL